MNSRFSGSPIESKTGFQVLPFDRAHQGPACCLGEQRTGHALLVREVVPVGDPDE